MYMYLSFERKPQGQYQSKALNKDVSSPYNSISDICTYKYVNMVMSYEGCKLRRQNKIKIHVVLSLSLHFICLGTQVDQLIYPPLG